MRSRFRPTIGQLKHRIELQSKALTPDGTDDYTEAYTTVGVPVSARVDPIAGGRMIDGVQDVERVTHRFIIRYRSDQADWQYVLFKSRRFLIRTVMNQDEDSRYLEIMAEELGAG